MCLGQRVLDYLVKLLKEELLTGFSPRNGFYPGFPPTSGVPDRHVLLLIIV